VYFHLAHKRGSAEIIEVTTDTTQDPTYCARSLIEEFLRAHDVDLSRCPIPTTITVDADQVTYEQYLFDADGGLTDDGDDVKREWVTVQQRAPWPLDTTS
jgi:hypothetical protein